MGSEEVEEEEEEGYRVKKKPELTKEQKEKLLLRNRINKRRPEFLREEWFRYKRIPRNWRRPDGISSKMRRNYKYRPSKVRVGFRGPADVRGLHSSGFDIESEMTIKMLKKGFTVMEIPIRCDPRKNGFTRISSFNDGFNIVKTIIKSTFYSILS